MNSYYQFVVTLMVVLPVSYFLWQGFQERQFANSLIRYFQFGEGLAPSSFFATLAASSSGLSPSIYMIMVYGYFYGLGVFPWVVGFWLLTQFASAFTIQRVEASEENGFLTRHGTLHEFLGKSFDSQRVRIAAAWLSVTCYGILLACEMLLGYEVVASVCPSNVRVNGLRLEWTALIVTLLIAGLLFGYTALSGFRAVIRTDKFQFGLIFVMLVNIWLVVFMNWRKFWLLYANTYPLNPFKAVFDPGGEGYLYFSFFFVCMNTVFWAAWWPSAMDQWHRAAASGQARVALDKRYGTVGIVSTGYFMFLTLTSLLAGSFVRTVVDRSGSESAILEHFLSYVIQTNSQHLFLGALLTGCILAGLAAAVISTADSYLVVALQSFVSDTICAAREGFDLKEADQVPAVREKYLLLAKTLSLTLFPLFLLVFIGISVLADVFTAIYFAFSLMLVTIPTLLMALTGRSKPEHASAAIMSLACGGIWGILSNSYIIWQIESALQLPKNSNITFYYNFLYANPCLNMLVAWSIFKATQIAERFRARHKNSTK